MIRPQAHQLTALAVFLLVTAAYLWMVVYLPPAYIWATYEDLVGEWAQTYLFAAGFVFSVLVAVSKSRYRWSFALLAAALFYATMEEISWGQRIFDFDSPDFFKRNNLQRETNLHNLLVGPFNTELKDFIEYGLAVALLSYGLIYPLVLRLGWGPARWAGRWMPAPPLYLWPFFVTGAWLETAPFHFNEAEVAEILIGAALVITAAHYWYAGRAEINAFEPPRWETPHARRFAGIVGASLAAVLVLATATTYWFYTSDSKRPRIEARLLNGYEKFAGRYGRYGRWNYTAWLYLRVHRAEPDRTSIIRRLASAYGNAGDEERFVFYAQKALDILLEIQAENPDKVSNNLALARTYKLLGDEDLAAKHGQRAHEIALERVREDPDSAQRAYWLGKTYRYLGDLPAAREQFQKAFEKRPSSKKYRKAYFDIRPATGG